MHRFAAVAVSAAAAREMYLFLSNNNQYFYPDQNIFSSSLTGLCWIVYYGVTHGGPGGGEVRPWEAMHFIVLKLGLSFSLWIEAG